MHRGRRLLDLYRLLDMPALKAERTRERERLRLEQATTALPQRLAEIRHRLLLLELLLERAEGRGEALSDLDPGPEDGWLVELQQDTDPVVRTFVVLVARPRLLPGPGWARLTRGLAAILEDRTRLSHLAVERRDLYRELLQRTQRALVERLAGLQAPRV